MNDRRLFALSDPHLSFHREKTMDRFGPNWIDHVRRIGENWRDTVGTDDIVLMPGDISWALRLDEARPDLEWLAALPGRKVLLRGNHDYWWASPKKLRALAPPGLYFVQNDSVLLDGVAIGGSRLWDYPFVKWGGAPATDAEKEGRRDDAPASGHKIEDPDKIRARELERLALSLGGLSPDADVRIAMTHYPPLGEDGLPTPLTDLIGGFDVDLCVFGHIHAPSAAPRPGEDALIDGTRYVLVASDHINHSPLHLLDI